MRKKRRLKPGPKPLPPGVRHDYCVSVRLNAAEYRRLKAEAAAARKALGAIVKARIWPEGAG